MALTIFSFIKSDRVIYGIASSVMLTGRLVGAHQSLHHRTAAGVGHVLLANAAPRGRIIGPRKD